LRASEFDLFNGVVLLQFKQFHAYFSDYKIIVLHGLKPERAMFRGKSLSAKKMYLLYDEESVHYSVITNLNGGISKRYICNG
jgi:hypothetical protein